MNQKINDRELFLFIKNTFPCYYRDVKEFLAKNYGITTKDSVTKAINRLVRDGLVVKNNRLIEIVSNLEGKE